MKLIVRLSLICLFAIAGNAIAAGGVCSGKFPNPIDDICWSCSFPWTLGGMQTTPDPAAEDANSAGGSVVCACKKEAPPRIGIRTSFWEPSRIGEVSRTPYCFQSLGGVAADVGVPAPRGTNKGVATGGTQGSSFYHVHWYMNPLIFWLEVSMDNKCLEKGSFDVTYFTEIDPLWADSITNFILNPDVALFANPAASLACAADCAATTLGFGIDALWWCGGCQGSMFPLDGHVAAHVGGVQASALLLSRFTSKLHRQLLMWSGSGEEGLCSLYPNPIMKKTNYKHQMIYPTPWTQKVDGRCCTPYGRSSVVWGAGKEFPYGGEDFAYQIFRKRDCCSGWGYSE